MYDVIVVGSGLVGSTLLTALQKTNLKTAVIEKELPSVLAGHDNDHRPISLSHQSCALLKSWGVWSSLASHACVIKAVHVSEAGRFGVLQFDEADFDGNAPGAVVPVHSLQKALYHKAADNMHCQFITSHDIRGIEQTDNDITLTYLNHEGERAISAKLLIAADGMNSPCRTLLNIPVKKHDHHDVAVTAILTLQHPHAHVAYERFTKHGVMAILPMWDPLQVRLVWTMSQKQRADLNEQSIITAVDAVFKGRLPVITDCQLMGDYPLQTQIAKQQVTGRAVLLGDSAHRLYPLAAQGYNLSLRDTRVLAFLLQQAQRQQLDIGSADLLSRYIAKRQSGQRAVSGLTQGLESLFGLHIPGVGMLRSTGLLAVNAIPGIKQSILDAIGG